MVRTGASSRAANLAANVDLPDPAGPSTANTLVAPARAGARSNLR